jgi:hypothetical protein
MENGLILIVDLPRERKTMMVLLWQVAYLKNDGLIVMGDLP